jgi:hypothetical protein
MENTQNIKDLVQKFYPYAKNALGFDHPVRVIMRKDAENAEQSLGKTAYYDPENNLIVLYVTNRHPKDILRSFSHELVHHAQNCRGDLDDLSTGGHYAKDGKGKEIEEEAYLQGNMNLRNYEDQLKFKGKNQMNEHYQIAKEDFKKLVASVVQEVVNEKKKKKKKKDFPDLTGDGKVTKADVLKGRGVELDEVDQEDMEDELRHAGELARVFKKKPKENLKEVNCEEIVKKVIDLERQRDEMDRATGTRSNDMESFFALKLDAEARDLREKHKNCFPQAEEPAGQGLPQGRPVTFRDLDEGFTYDTMTPEQKKKGIEREESMIAAEEERLKKSLAYPVRDEADAAYRERAKRTYKRNVEKSEKIIARLKGGKPDPVPANPYPTSGDDSRDAGRDMDGAGNPRPHSRRGYQESKQQETLKEVIKEVPKQKQEVKETNKAWYNASLYNKLVSNWTKKGDK